MADKYKKQIRIFLYLSLAGLFLVTRIWRVATIPSGLHIDEAGMAYDAWCLANYGVDRGLKSWPVYLVNYGGGQSVMYAYLCALLFRVFGYHRLLIRVPGILFSLLALIFGVLLTRKIYPESIWKPFFAGLLFAICPYFIMASRFGLDCNLMLGASMAFLYFFIQAVSANRKRYYVLAGLAGGLTLYTYALSYIIVPLFLLLAFLYVIRGKGFSLKGWILLSVPLVFLAFPLIMVQIVNIFDLPEMKLGVFTITRMEAYRASDIAGFSLENLRKALQSIFLGDSLTYNSIPGIPNLYVMTIPLFLVGFAAALLGLIKEIMQKKTTPMTFLLLWFIASFLLYCCLASTVNRVNGIFGVTVIFAVHGLFLLCGIRGRIGKAVPVVAGGIYALCFVQFGVYYYGGQYTAEHSPMSYFDVPVTEAVTFLEENPQCRGQGVYMAQTPEYFALSMLPSPYEMEIRREDKTFFDYYHCGTLPAIREGYNYIVRDHFADYAGELRKKGYEENKYEGYSLFYQNWNEG